MKKTTFADETQKAREEFFAEDFLTPNQLIVDKEKDLQPQKSPLKNEKMLDKLLSIIKWIFLYLPGVALIHLAMMGLAIMFFYGEYEPFGLLGLIALGTFLIMLGFGKMRDLKYLKTILTILSFSLITAIFYDLLAVFIKGDFFGFYAKLTLPLIALIGYLSKRSVDKEDED